MAIKWNLGGGERDPSKTTNSLQGVFPIILTYKQIHLTHISHVLTWQLPLERQCSPRDFMSPNEVEATRKTTTWGNPGFLSWKGHEGNKVSKKFQSGEKHIQETKHWVQKNRSVYWGHLGYQFPWDSGSKQQEYSKLSRHYSLVVQHLLNMFETLGKPSAPQISMHTEYPRLRSIGSCRNRAYADL